MTVKEILPRRMVAPMGSSPPKSCCRTVAPSRQTAFPARSSFSLKTRPAAKGQSRTTRNSLVLPVMEVDQLTLRKMAWRVVVTGATALSPKTSRSMAVASAILNRLAAF
jgi:hypothetical protein